MASCKLAKKHLEMFRKSKNLAKSEWRLCVCSYKNLRIDPRIFIKLGMDISRLLRDSHIPAFNNTNLVFVGIISDREFLWKTRQVVSRQRLPGIDFQVSVCRPMSHWNFGGEPPSLWGQITCFPINSVTVTLKNVNEYTKTLRSYRANLIKSGTEVNEVSTFF